MVDTGAFDLALILARIVGSYSTCQRHPSLMGTLVWKVSHIPSITVHLPFTLQLISLTSAFNRIEYQQ